MVTLLITGEAVTTCERKEMRRVQEVFTNCTKHYKTEYDRDVSNTKKDILSLTCQLVDKIVSVCGDEWRQCHGEEEVRVIKEMQVESLLIKNRGTLPVDIEKCSTILQFRSHQLQFADPPACTDDQTVRSQEEFQNCTHSVTTTVESKIQSINSAESISRTICKALNTISHDCVKHLEKCLDEEDVIILTKTHIEQLKRFFVKVAERKVEEDLDINNCENYSKSSEASENEIRNNKSVFTKNIDTKNQSLQSNMVLDDNENIEETQKKNDVNIRKQKQVQGKHDDITYRKNADKNLSSAGFFMN